MAAPINRWSSGEGPEPYHTSEKLARELGRAQERDDLEFIQLRRSLSQPSEPDSALDLTLARCLDVLYALGDGGVFGYNRERIKGGESDGIPTSDVLREIQAIQRRYDRCSNNFDRLLVVGHAWVQVILAQYAPSRSKVKGTAEWREAIANDPRSTRVIAAVYGISHQTVARIKRQAGTSDV